MSHGPAGADGARMESLFDLTEPTADWAEADLAAMLRHQLAQPLEPDGPAMRDLLEAPTPSVESLQSLKRLAKIRRAQRDAAVPQDLWRVIYFASIAAALRSGSRISDLTPGELRQGFQWTLARPWLDASIRSLLERAERDAL